MIQPPTMDAASLTRSRAEILFAELLVEDSSPSKSRIGEVCAAHPDLAPELERLHTQPEAMRAMLPPWAAPAGDGAVGTVEPPLDLGAFRCSRLLGRGGMGEVWEAQDLALGRTVAVNARDHRGTACQQRDGR